MTAVQVYDLPKQSDFLHSARNQIPHFAYDLIDGTASLRAARLRDDAERAMHVASRIIQTKAVAWRGASCWSRIVDCEPGSSPASTIENRKSSILL